MHRPEHNERGATRTARPPVGDLAGWLATTVAQLAHRHDSFSQSNGGGDLTLLFIRPRQLISVGRTSIEEVVGNEMGNVEPAALRTQLRVGKI